MSAVVARPIHVGRLGVIDPHLYGQVSPRTLGDLERAGYRVTRIGSAALCRRGEFRFVFVVLSRRTPSPAWAERVRLHHRYLRNRRDGRPTGRDRRLELVRARARRRRMVRDDAGRFVGRPPWWATLDAHGHIANPRSPSDPNPLGLLVQPWRLT